MSIATEITRLQNAKAAIKISIENKGVVVPSTTKLDNYNSLINSIQQGNTKIDTSYSINNQAIVDFDTNITYTTDYSTTQMGNYDHPTSYTNYGKPNGVIPTNMKAGTLILTDIAMGKTYSYSVSATDKIYNVSPNSVCYYQIINNNIVESDGQLSPTGKVRTLYGSTLKNCRDIGGWSCNGGTVKYGKLFRTSELIGASRPTEQITDEEKNMFINLLGIKCEIDMRESSESGGIATFPSSQVEYLHQPIGNYKDALNTTTERAKTKIVMEKIMNNAIKGLPTFYHCVAGADRTGTITWLLLALLGVSQSDCDKEYELTCLSGPTRFRNKEYSTLGYLSGLYNYINSLGKSSFIANIVEMFRLLDIDNDLVNDFRKAMIDGNPSPLVYDVPSLTITTNGTYNVSKVNTAIVNIPITAHSGTVTIGTSSVSTLTINVGFSNCTMFAMFCNSAPQDTNTNDCFVWNRITGYSAWSRYRGTYNAAYGSDGGTITVSGTNVTITISQSNVNFCRNRTYTWVAL